MPDDFVRTGEFEEFRRSCDHRHEEVDKVEKEVKDLRECVSRKFNRHTGVLILLLGGVIVDLVLRVVSMAAAKGGP